MNALALALSASVALVATAFVVYFRSRRIGSQEVEGKFGVVCGCMAFAVVISGTAVWILPGAQARASSQSSVTHITRDLLPGELGYHVELLGPWAEERVSHTVRGEDGHPETRSADLERSTFVEGDGLNVVEEVTTMAPGFFWPWPVTLKSRYAFTFPTEAAFGIRPEKG